MIEKILERLEAERCDLTDYKSSEDRILVRHWNNCVDVCKEIVQEVAKEYGKDTNVRSNGWISVEDRLPEERKDVLVWHSEMNMHCVAWYNPPTRIWYSNDFEITDSKRIIAWCELPAPYQKGE